mgnify:CR=1 FL=1
MTLKLNDTYIKPFIKDEELSAIESEVKAAHKCLLSGNGEGSDFLGWVDLPVNYDKEEFNRIKSLGYENFKLKNGQVVYEVEGEKLFKIKAPEGTEIEIRDTDI